MIGLNAHLYIILGIITADEHQVLQLGIYISVNKYIQERGQCGRVEQN
jgi:hypothetical protein